MRTWRVAALAFLCSGCSDRYFVGFEMAPANRAIVSVLGHDALIVVHNGGPGTVDVSFDQSDDVYRLGPADSTTMRKSPTTIAIRSKAGQASVSVTARGATGIRVDQSPSPTGR